MRVLLVDDSEIDTLLTRATLDRAGLGADVEISGLASLALHRLSAQGAPALDLILLDLNMPAMDGFEFIQAFDKLEFAARRPAIVVLSNSPMPADRARALAHRSVRDYIVKPLSIEVAARLQQLVADHAAAGPLPGATHAAP